MLLGEISYEHLCKSMGKIEKGLFDYRAPVYFDFLGYFFPVFTASWDLHKLKKKLLSSKKPFFKAFITATDQLCHSRGKEHLKNFLMKMSRELGNISEDNELVLFSDHGNNFVKSKRIALEEYLKNAGFVVKNNLTQENDIVFPNFGLLNFVALYMNGNKRLLAEKLSQFEGIELVIFQEGEWVYTYKGSEKARSTYNDRGFKYEALSGDPLNLLNIISEIKKSDGYVAKDEIYHATQGHIYNNVLEKIHNSIDCVKNPASILLSLEDGYHFGKRWFELVVRLKGTHGGLRSETTDGFLMTNFEATEDYLRIKEVARYMQ